MDTVDVTMATTAATTATTRPTSTPPPPQHQHEEIHLPDVSSLAHQGPPKLTESAVNALTPPTSEDMNTNKLDDGSSDLSDLDDLDDLDDLNDLGGLGGLSGLDGLDNPDDEQEEEEVVPDHYYGDGKVPVFKPTMDQFRDFEKFIDKIDKYGMQSGIVKVVPPKEWRDSLPDLSELVKTIKIKNPITQEFMGTHGTYTQANIEKQRSYNLPEWKSLTEEPQHQPPARRGERRRNQDKIVRGGASTRTRASQAQKTDTPGQPAAARRRGRPRKNPLPEPAQDADQATEAPLTPVSPSNKAVDPVEHVTPTKSKPKPKPRGRPSRNAGQAKSVSSRRMNNMSEKNDIIDEAAFEDFDYKMDHLDEFTAERCAELETAYWKSLTFAPPMYAADMPGSLFEDKTTSWNVASLPNLLDVIGTKVPGVNTAYLYMGMWKATFAWHLEDVDLYSINYIHFGAPKQWYSISQEDARKFEAAMRTIWPNDSKNCDQFLRHKTYLISPELLQRQFGIKVNKLVHHEGEFVITYPYGYHSGYNLGYNCAESVNFATEAWLDYGRIARKCDCEADSVWVDVADIERKLRGEPTPEYYEETDDDDEEDNEHEAGDLPSPPASVAGKPKAQSRKRKRDPKEKDAGKKKKRIRIRIKAPTREPCVLCPNDALYEPLLPTDNGRMAHRACALFTPETWLGQDNGVETVFGVTTIDKARLELKCNYCRSKRGACFQCNAKKCTRAFHATCALAAGVQVDAGMVPTFGEDGTEYFEEGFDCRCRFHRPKRAKNVDVEALESSKLINNYAKTLKKGDIVQAQYLHGDIFAGLVVTNRPDEMSVLIDVLPDGDRVELEWKWLAVLDPIDSLRPKPSSSAIPMPEGMNKKSVSIENRQDGIPTMEQPFHDDRTYKWAEFVNLDLPPSGYAQGTIKNSEQVKIDMDKPDHLYHYLPTLSTEAKSRWTDNPGNKTHVAKADFLDRVKPAPAHRAPTASHGPVHKPASAPPRQGTIERPYMYKPKKPSPPIQPWVDQQSLAYQHQFTQDAQRRASYSNNMRSPYAAPPPTTSHNAGDPNRHSPGTLRPFPGDAYYSSRVLPAAIPGEYSAFSEQVRRNSGVERRPSSGMQSHIRQPSSGSDAASVAHVARIMSGNHGSPPMTHGHPYTLEQPAPQATTIGNESSQNNRFLPTKEEPPVTKTLPKLPLPALSSATPADAFHRSDVEWAPPSRTFSGTPSNPTPQSYPANHLQALAAPMTRPQPTYQSTEDFRSQLGVHGQKHSPASRHGTYERLLRDMGAYASRPNESPDATRRNMSAANSPYESTTTAGGASNGFQIPPENADTGIPPQVECHHRASQSNGNHSDGQQPQQQQPYQNGQYHQSYYGNTNQQSFPSPKAPEYSPLSQVRSPAHGTWGVPVQPYHTSQQQKHFEDNMGEALLRSQQLQNETLAGWSHQPPQYPQPPYMPQQ